MPTRLFRLNGLAVLRGGMGLLTALWFVTVAGAQAPVRKGGGTGEGRLLHPRGSVEVLRAGSAAWSAVTTNTILRPGDTVRTGKGSRALIQLTGGPLDGSVIRLDERSRLRLEPGSREGGFLMKMLRGAAYFFHREKAVRTEFDTPLVSGAIRGTEFLLAVADDGRTTVTVMDGAVELRGSQGEFLALVSGESAVVEPGQPPRKTAALEAANVIQWCLYYPAVIGLDELAFPAADEQALSASLAAYRGGDLVRAFGEYPVDRAPASAVERVYFAQLLLAMGQVGQAEVQLDAVTSSARPVQAQALQTLVAAVRFQPGSIAPGPRLASVLLAESYHHQAWANLPKALAMAREAVAQSPNNGFAWARVAELEFGFGRIGAARQAVNRALQLAPRHAQAMATKGFLLASEGRIGDAQEVFEQAIAIDSALGNAWLGRGLCRIRRGDGAGGRDDLLIAAALEPNRAMLRSYLGKALGDAGEGRRALAELDMTKQLDSRDPTAWLYSALLNRQGNRINDAVRDLEHSQSLNDNRQVYRSRLLLDQDRAVRSANLANIYRDAGMADVSVREASRAVAGDYANYSAHLFLAESFNALRDPNLINLRYETATISELLVANLLAPAGAGAFSSYVTLQEYSRLFERDGVGFTSDTLYLSRGDWSQDASHFGTFGRVSYALDVGHRSYTGQRPNHDFEQLVLAGTFKLQLTPRDTLLLLPIYADNEGGDLRQLYDPAAANRTFRFTEGQEPNVFVGYQHEWQPGVRTLLLAGRLHDEVEAHDDQAQLRTLVRTNGVIADMQAPGFRQFAIGQRTSFEAVSAEAQQIWQTHRHTLVGGARYQTGWTDSAVDLRRISPSSRPYPTAQEASTELDRWSVYGYWHWRIVEPLQVLGGLSYDRLNYPENVSQPPISSGQERKEQLLPKVGLVWTPDDRFAARTAWTRSLGGLFYDGSVRLEPTQLAGFTQAYRSLIPESVAGQAAGTEFETWGAELEYRLPTDTYLAVRGEVLESEARRMTGLFEIQIDDLGNVNGPLASGTPERLDFREKSLTVSVNQLLGAEWALGASYRLSEATLNERLEAIPYPRFTEALNRNRAVLQQAGLFAGYAHPSGVFAQAQAQWTHQSNGGYADNPLTTPREDLPGADFWQFHLFAGWRFAQRRAEVAVGVLNLTDRDYRLNPLNYHLDLPRERTLLARVRFSF